MLTLKHLTLNTSKKFNIKYLLAVFILFKCLTLQSHTVHLPVLGVWFRPLSHSTFPSVGRKPRWGLTMLVTVCAVGRKGGILSFLLGVKDDGVFRDKAKTTQ